MWVHTPEFRRIVGATKLSACRASTFFSASEVGRSLFRDIPAIPLAMPSVEAARLEAVTCLSLDFVNLVAGILGQRSSTTFEELLLCHSRTLDPLLPADSEAVSFMHKILGTANVSDYEIDNKLRLLLKMLRKARARVLAAELATACADDPLRPRVERIMSGSKAGRVKMTLAGAIVEIGAEHYEKLFRLYTFTVIERSGIELGGKNVDIFPRRDLKFQSAVFCMLCRYNAAQGGMHHMGGGHHTALHADVFDVLLVNFGVDAECFASPLNCRWRQYFSAHPDTDSLFGSLGSFFEFAPIEGSFECNPPFEEGLILRCAHHIDRLMKRAEWLGKPLSFIIFTPYWPGRAAWEALFQSAFRTYSDVVPLRDHGYVEVIYYSFVHLAAFIGVLFLFPVISIEF
jgi:phosphorylated CTD-interacting factor 1